MKRTALLIALVAGVTAGFGQPAYMNYQGRLLDPGGQPLTNGTYILEFNIYDSANGTNRVWGPFYCDDGAGDGHATRAVIANGRFNVILGPNDASLRALAEAFQEDERFVEIRVNDGAPILPRQQILSAPYALRSRYAQQAQLAQQAVVASNLLQQVADTLSPPGTIVAFGGNTVPAGWLLCDGSAVASKNYPRLFAAIGPAWGNGTYHQGVVESPANPGTDFNIPDLRGVFLRGVNGLRTNPFTMDPDWGARTTWTSGSTGNAVGSVQTNQFQSHNHANSDWKYLVRISGANTIVSADNSPTEADVKVMGLISPAGGNETRPVNAYVNYLIKH